MFIIADESGAPITTTSHFEVALGMMRDLPFASRVIRESDGEVLAVRSRPLLTSRKRGSA